MAENETYVTKANPDQDDWIAYNKDYFAALKGEALEGPFQFAPFVDVDIHAEKAGIDVETYVAQLKEKVGPLGPMALRLVHSEMDDAFHVVIRRDDSERSS